MTLHELARQQAKDRDAELRENTLPPDVEIVGTRDDKDVYRVWTLNGTTYSIGYQRWSETEPGDKLGCINVTRLENVSFGFNHKFSRLPLVTK